jgi:hypothetical protein
MYRIVVLTTQSYRRYFFLLEGRRWAGKGTAVTDISDPKLTTAAVIAAAEALKRAEAASIDGVRVRMLPDGRMDRENAARYVGRQPKTMAMWAMLGKGPRWVKVGGRIFYYRADLDAFIRGEVALDGVNPSSEPDPAPVARQRRTSPKPPRRAGRSSLSR